ncbi:MAG: hypothetical protein AAFR46_15510 [Pseudomonadota bacterium]
MTDKKTGKTQELLDLGMQDGADTFELVQFEDAPSAAGGRWNVFYADIFNEPHDTDADAPDHPLLMDASPLDTADDAASDPSLLVISSQDFWV